MDLPDAYRGCPCHPQDLKFSYTSVYDQDHKCLKFLKLDSFAFGLTSAVVSFNRLPKLVVAAARRRPCGQASAFFDDLSTLDRVNARRIGDDALRKVLSFVGAAPAPEKCFPPTAVRTYLGASVDVSAVHSEGSIRFTPKTHVGKKGTDHGSVSTGYAASHNWKRIQTSWWLGKHDHSQFWQSCE